MKTMILLAVIWCGFFVACKKNPPAQKAETLPIYKLATPTIPEQELLKLSGELFNLSGNLYRTDEKMTLRTETIALDVFPQSGAVWLADQSQMWNPSLRPQLPDTASARKLAADFFGKNQFLLPKSDRQPFSVAFSNFGGTFASVFDVQQKKRTDQKLDIQVNYNVTMQVPGSDGKTQSLPVVGGGGDFNLTFGDQSKLIGYSGGWRPIEKIETESPVIPKAKADEQFKSLTKDLKIVSFESKLAYYAAPASARQEYLYPVYVYSAVVQIDQQRVPLRIITLPATEWGPKMALSQESRQPRGEKDFPQRRSTMPDEQSELRNMPNQFKIDTTSSKRQALPPNYPWAEAGTSWIGLSQGLPGSQNNARGFVDGLAADGWTVNFNWGEADAWESDWRRNDDSWVDATDFVFYTGHANMNGWVLNSPDDNFMDFSEVGATPGASADLWGQQDLEWFIVAACGPLQDDVISPGGGSVFDRWDGAFDGLHQLLGYGAVTYDNEDEGKTVVRYARGGETLINAWFRTAREIQPATNGFPAPDGPTIWVGVMYVGRSGVDPNNDHIHAHGPLSADPTSPTFYVAIWTTT